MPDGGRPRLEFHPVIAAPFGHAAAIARYLGVVWRYRRWVRNFEFVSTPRVRLWYDRRARTSLDFDAHLASWDAVHQDLHERFGFSIERRLDVVLFATTRDATHVFGDHALGRASSTSVALDLET